MKQNEIKCIYYIRLLSETNRKTWVRENVRETESHPLYIVTPFMGVLFGISHTRTRGQNLLSVLVTHSSILLMSPDTPARVWHLR